MPQLRRRLDRRASTIIRFCALPTAIGTVALLLRLYGLADKPFWLDEITTLRRATSSVPDLVASALHNNHYPSYFLLLWLVARLGDSQFLLRLPSAVFGAIGASLTCAIGTKAAGARSGAVAGLLMALSPFEVQLGQEARSYTLVSCLILLALLGVVQLAEETAASAPALRRGAAPRGAWAAYVLGTAAALSVLNVAVPWLFAANLAAAVIAWRAGEARRAFVRQWSVAQAIVLALWAPSLVVLLLLNHGGMRNGAEWAPAETIATVWSALAPVYLLRISDFIRLGLAPAAVPGLSVVVVALAGFGVWRLRRDLSLLAILGAAALLLPLGVLLISPIVPLLVPRYLAWSAAPFFVFVGAGLGRVAGTRQAALAAALVAVCFVNLIPYYGYETKPRWDLAARELATEAKPGDVVLANRGYTYYVFAIFAARAGLAERGVRLARHLPEALQLAPGHDVWALFGRVGQGRVGPPEAYLRSLTPLGRPIADYTVGRYIVLYRFREEPPAGASVAPVRAAQP